MSGAWNVWEPFSGEPESAFILAQIFSRLKETIKINPDEAVATLDQAIKELYPYTQIYQAQYKVYKLAVEGKLSPKTTLLSKLKTKSGPPISRLFAYHNDCT